MKTVNRNDRLKKINLVNKISKLLLFESTAVIPRFRLTQSSGISI